MNIQRHDNVKLIKNFNIVYYYIKKLIWISFNKYYYIPIFCSILLETKLGVLFWFFESNEA